MAEEAGKTLPTTRQLVWAVEVKGRTCAEVERMGEPLEVLKAAGAPILRIGNGLLFPIYRPDGSPSLDAVFYLYREMEEGGELAFLETAFPEHVREFRALRAAAREAGDELGRIDALLDRRLTLDGLTRVEAVALALRVCEQADPQGDLARTLRPNRARGEEKGPGANGVDGTSCRSRELVLDLGEGNERPSTGRVEGGTIRYGDAKR